jgi:hypothetical protein
VVRRKREAASRLGFDNVSRAKGLDSVYADPENVDDRHDRGQHSVVKSREKTKHGESVTKIYHFPRTEVP